MTQYHPDKVNNLADDFKELADKKTKEINEKYEILLAFLEQKDK
jgi:DnaJ-class molecular chaperone